MINDFAVMILTYDRPDNIHTLKSLKKSGYSGEIYFVISDDDPSIDKYQKAYGDKVKIFSKEDISTRYDEGDNFRKRGSVFYARNASFEISKDLGLKYFIQLDDDYTEFSFRFNKEFDYKFLRNPDLDRTFELMVEFMRGTAITSVAMAQGGDFIGGSLSEFSKKVRTKRKCMNTFICDVDKPIGFIGKINEDVNTYTCKARSGLLLLTTNQISINQVTTQKGDGGMTDLYKDGGTYVKSFYSVLYAPSCVRVSVMNSKNMRIHHKVKWNNCTPKLLREVK